MPSIDEVCTAAASAINGISGLRSKGYADEAINEPDVHIFTRDFDPRLVFRSDKRTLPMTARLFLKATDSRVAQVQARSFMEPSGSTSVMAKIEDTASWSQTVDYAEVTQVSGPAQVELSGVVRWYVDFEFDVCW